MKYFVRLFNRTSSVNDMNVKQMDFTKGTHIYNGGSETGVLGHPPAGKARHRVLKSRSQNAPLYMCVSQNTA